MHQPTNYQPAPTTIQQPNSASQMMLDKSFAPSSMANYNMPDPNSNNQVHQFPPASSQFNMPNQSLEAYPQVQTQISLQGLPPLTVNTMRINPNEYS